MKKNSMFLKVFIPFFACILLLSGAFSVYSFKKISESMLEKAYSNSKMQLLQTRNTIEQQTQLVENAYIAYTSSSRFNEIINGPVDQNNFRSYYDVKAELGRLESLSSLTNFNESSLVSLAGGWKIQKGSLFQLTSEQKENYREIINAQDKNIGWMKKDDVLQMMILLPMNSSHKRALGTFTIPQSELKKLVGDDSNKISIYRNYEPIFYQSEELLPPQSIVKEQTKQLKINDVVVIPFEGKEYMLTKSPYNSWLYVSTLDFSAEQSAILKLGVSSFMIVFFLFAVISLFFYRYSSRIFKPIAAISKVLELDNADWRENELDLIEKGIGVMISRNSGLMANVKQQKNQLKNLFMLSIFNNQLNREELISRAHYYGYDIEDKEYSVALIRITNMSHHNVPDRQLFLVAVNNIITETIPSKDRLMPIVLNEDIQATIVNGDRNQVTAYYEQIQSAIQQYLNIETEVGISNQFSDLFEAKSALEEAKEALYHQQKESENLIRFYSDVWKDFYIEPIKYPLELQNRLFELIRSDGEGIQEQLSAIVESIYEQNGNFLSKNTAMIRFVNEVFQFSYVIGVNIEDFQYYSQVYQEILAEYDSQKIKTYIYEKLIVPIKLANERNNLQSKASVSQQMIDIIHKEYSNDLTLELLGQRLHYNPSYLGRVFKRDFDMNFGEYIAQYRLDVSLDLLKDTSLPIAEIAEKLQYNNSQNFIRFFKKKMNMTPNEYRQAYRMK